MQRVLSFDCANKSLAYTHVTFNFDIWNILHACTHAFEDLSDVGATLTRVRELSRVVDDVFRVHKSGSLDVLGGLNVRDVDEISRMRNLADTLNSLDIEITHDDVVLVEDQPEAKNTPSYAVQSGIQMYYLLEGARVELVNPRRKNHINIDESIHMSVFTRECVDSYSANKMHSSANFLRLARHWKLERMLLGLEKYDDVSDSFMQAFGWFIDESKRRHNKTPLNHF